MGTATFDQFDLDRLRERHSFKWRAYPADVLPSFVAETDFPAPPCVAAALHEAVDAGDLGYAWAGGVGEAFAAFAGARHGWTVDPDRVLLTADVMSGVDEVLGHVTAPGDGVVINPPVYPPFFRHIEALGRRVVGAPLARTGTRWEIDLDAVEAAFRGGACAYLLCSPHNPTGRVWSRAELEAVAALADRYGVTVVADEIHAPLTLAGATHVPYLSLGEVAAAHAVVVTSTSKAFNLPGLKSAVIVVGSDAVLTALAGRPDWMVLRAGILGILASLAAWCDGGPWLDELLRHLDGTRRRMGELLEAHLPEVGYEPPEATYLAWLDCRALGLGDEPAATFLERGGVALGRGLDFGAPGAGHVRVTMGTTPAILEQLVERMAVAVR